MTAEQAVVSLRRASVALGHDVLMPRLALGTFRLRGEEAKEAVSAAIYAGYRHIDTASIYKNESEIAAALQSSSIPRSQVFITTKLSPFEQGYDAALAACQNSLTRLQTDYIDLYLIHWPGTAKVDSSSPANCEMRLASWRALEHLYRQGKCRAIGVSNFTEQHLKDLLQVAEVKPAVNQVELHPLLSQQSLRNFCTSHSIAVTAYSPLGCGELLHHPVVVQIASRIARSPSQVLLQWGLQSGSTVVPKSRSPARIRENAELDFTLAEEDMSLLNQLDEGKHFCWDPNRIA